MDAAGVDVQLVAPWMDLAGYHLAGPAGLGSPGCRTTRWPRWPRLIPTGSGPPPPCRCSNRSWRPSELRRAVTELGHQAVQIGARVNELGLDDPGLDVFWDAVEELDVPLIVHPAELDVPERSRRLFLHILVGNPSETTFAAAALMLGGVLERHPRLRVLLVHGGGFVPYQIGRLDRGFSAAPPAAQGARHAQPARAARPALVRLGGARRRGAAAPARTSPRACRAGQRLPVPDAAWTGRSARWRPRTWTRPSASAVLGGAGLFSAASRSTPSAPPPRDPGERWTG